MLLGAILQAGLAAADLLQSQLSAGSPEEPVASLQVLAGGALSNAINVPIASAGPDLRELAAKQSRQN
jgi:hypothetical protein